MERVFDVSAVEPDAVSAQHLTVALPDAQIIRGRFEDATIGQPYGLVHSNHSIYYFSNLAKGLDKAVAGLQPGGMMVIVVWERDCELSLLGRLAAGSQAPVADDVVNWVRCRADLVARVVRVEGGIHWSRISSLDDENLSSLLGVVLRGDRRLVDKVTLERARRYIQTRGAMGTRRNAVIAVEHSTRS